LEDLRRRLDRADEERRDKDRQLTDKRPKAEALGPNAGARLLGAFLPPEPERVGPPPARIPRHFIKALTKPLLP